MSGRTTGFHAVLDEAASWYVIVSDGGGSRVVPLADDVDVVFGRAAESTVVVDHDAVSRRHAIVRRRGTSVTVEDLGSRNGTAVNGTPITGTRRVTSGDVIRLGPATVIVATSSAARGRQIATMDEFAERLDAEVERALRYRRPLSLAMLRVTGDTAPAAIDALLQRLRRMDLVAEYGPDELAILLPETPREGAELVAERAAESCPGARHGVAAFPDDGASAGELVSNARARLRGARAAERRAGPGVPVAKLPSKLIVADPLMKQVYELAARAAATTISVVVVGETGTGKEMVADAMHRLSTRANGPFVRVNCAALAEHLVESELFGHEAGAFTGAVGAKAGLFEAASGGTLFLDEVGELPLAIQAKLLRVLETWRIVRLGGTRELPVDVRLVCATNRDLEAEVTRGRFREDLLFRIAAFVIPVPPLRDRPSEIVPMAVQFAYEIASELGMGPIGFTPEALDALRGGSWPGNVRELRNVIERAVVLSGGERIDVRHLPEQLVIDPAPATPEIRRRPAELERDMLRAALEATGGNQTQAAKRLGISRFALIRLLAKHGLKK